MNPAPHHLDAERALLGILLDSPALLAVHAVTPGDLDPARGHDAILAAILTVAEGKGTADPVLVAQELAARDQLNRIGEGTDRAGAYLHTLLEVGRNAPALGHYAQLIRAATVRRRVHQVGTRLVQTAETAADTDVLLDTASQLLVGLQMVVDQPLDSDAPIPGLSTVAEFLTEPVRPHSWVIPGLIERADRVLLVAGEGVGKSELSRQVGLLAAAGRHPFSPRRRIPPVRVLLVDLENPPALVRRRLGVVERAARQEGLDFADRLIRWNRPAGLDLRSAAGKALFLSAIDRTRPDLVCVGPLYKMSASKPGDTYEIDASETAHVIDQVRDRYGCAFWIEHHLPKGDHGSRGVQPLGSSYWMRWPEFGRVLRQAERAEGNVFELARSRGDRDERCWPERLVKHAGRWPWTADYDPDTALELDRILTEDVDLDGAA